MNDEIGLRVCPECGRGYAPRAERCPEDGAPLGPVDTLLGATISGRYLVEARIGVGGMGAVYRAVQQDLERNVAIKVVSSTALENADAARRFRREAQIIAQLHHPSTLKLFDFGRLPDGRPFLVTEFLEGRTLGALAEAAPLPWPRLLGLLRQVCASLEEAHAQGIIHRDLKPDNVFVVDVHGEDAAKVLDFGIAKLGQSSDTATGLVFGTPSYMSPEQAAGHPASARSDLYSLGVIAYRCLVGRPPFISENPMALLLKHINEAPVPPRRAIDDPRRIPVEVEALVLRLLEKDPARRLESATAVRLAVDALLAEADGPDEPVTVVRAEAQLAGPEPATSPLEATPASGAYTAGESGPLPCIPRGDRTALRVAAAVLALLLGGAAALWAAMHGDPVPVVEVIPPAPEAAPSRPPPLEPTSADDAPLASEAQPKPPEVEPERKPRPPRPRRPARSSPKREKKREDVEAPPGFLDFEI